MLDLLLAGGTLVDGTGSPGRRADVGIAGGRVVAIGADIGDADRTIDVTGRIVAPGFIDVHTHLDAQAFWDTTLSPSPLHGVTTVIAGNCGFSVAPLAATEADYLMRMLARVEGMPLRSLAAGVPWDWSTTAEYLERLDGRLAVNAGFMVGHSALRRMVMGEAANERTATADELARMCAALATSLAAGGLGFSSTWAATHNDAEGRPVPSRFADAAELVALAGVCRDFDGTSLEYLPFAGPSVDLPEDDLEVMIQMSLAAGRPLNWNVVHPDVSSRERVEERLAKGTIAAERGAQVVMLVMPQAGSGRFSFSHGFVLDAIPGWRDTMSLPIREKCRALADPAVRARLAEAARNDVGHPWMTDWANQMITEGFSDATRPYVGRVVRDVAAEQGKDPFDALLDLALADGLFLTFRAAPVPETREDWEVRAAVCSDERALIGGSDAGAHLDIVSQQGYAPRFIGGAVREHGVLSLEEAVRLVTSKPAALYGLIDRGTVVEGAWADLVVFDPDEIGCGPVTTAFDLPEGAGRLVSSAVGIDEVIVNGDVIVEGGEFTAARPGTVLRSGRDTTSRPLTPTTSGSRPVARPGEA